MAVHVSAHYDGKVLVLDEPVDLPINQPLTLEVSIVTQSAAAPPTEAELDEAFERLKSMAVSGTNIPDEALTSDGYYADD